MTKQRNCKEVIVIAVRLDRPPRYLLAGPCDRTRQKQRGMELPEAGEIPITSTSTKQLSSSLDVTHDASDLCVAYGVRQEVSLNSHFSAN
jgi:hypothetical protein